MDGSEVIVLECKKKNYQKTTKNQIILLNTYDVFKNRKMLKMSECIKEENMDAYMNLNDSIFHQILLSPDPNLQKSKDILQALQRRRLYKCAAESVPIEGTRFNDVGYLLVVFFFLQKKEV